jgi:hypothetical protein
LEKSSSALIDILAGPAGSQAMCPWRSAMEVDSGEPTTIQLVALVPVSAHRRFPGAPSLLVQDCTRRRCGLLNLARRPGTFRRSLARPRLEATGFCGKHCADGCVALALLNFRRVGRPLDCGGGQPNRQGF